uniref:Uncharacterized protein n=1 Tax=Clytia hemisphaerica TaxID=252671 RepID=A0A7M5XN46_9CNID
MPMLVSQTCAMKGMKNIVWQDHLKDMMVSFTFVANIVIITCVCSSVLLWLKKKELAILSIVLPVPICFLFMTPVYIARFGLLFLPDHATFLFDGQKVNDSFAVLLMQLTVYLGLIGLWIWVFILAIAGVMLIAAACKFVYKTLAKDFRRGFLIMIILILLNFASTISAIVDVNQYSYLHAFDSAVTFFILLTLAKISYCIASFLKLDQPINQKYPGLLYFVMTFILEMPMLLSYVVMIKQIKEIDAGWKSNVPEKLLHYEFICNYLVLVFLQYILFWEKGTWSLMHKALHIALLMISCAFCYFPAYVTENGI